MATAKVSTKLLDGAGINNAMRQRFDITEAQLLIDSLLVEWKDPEDPSAGHVPMLPSEYAGKFRALKPGAVIRMLGLCGPKFTNAGVGAGLSDRVQKEKGQNYVQVPCQHLADIKGALV